MSLDALLEGDLAGPIATPGTVILRGEGLSKAFGGNQAVDQVSFDLRAGEVHAFVGENGAGKSTLAKLISGVLTSDEGTLEVDGLPAHFPGPHDAQAAGIAMVHQELSVVSSLSVAENVLFGVEPSRWGWMRRQEMAATARKYLDVVGLHVAPNLSTARLSTAQRQLLEIAHVLALNARIIILDEPTSSLATSDARHLRKLIGALREAGRTVVLVSHDFDEVLDVADRVTCLRDGQWVSTEPANTLDHDQLIRLVTGRDVLVAPREARIHTGEAPVLEVRELVGPGLTNADLVLHPGEILGIGGLVGSGRTELMRILAGDVRPTAGSMTLFGEPYAPNAPSAALKRGVSLVPESRKEQGLILHATVLQNIELAALDTLGSGPFFRAGAARMLAAEYVEKLRIKVSSVHAPVNSLSGGNQQKVVLAKVLATRPRVLLLDEPTKGIDVGAKAEILTLMRGLAAQGISVVMVSSVLQELLDSCDRIVVMRGGRTVGDLENVDVTEEDLARLAFAG